MKAIVFFLLKGHSLSWHSLVFPPFSLLPAKFADVFSRAMLCNKTSSDDGNVLYLNCGKINTPQLYGSIINIHLSKCTKLKF